MRLARFFLGGATLLLLAATARAEGPADPLGLVPEQADFLLKVEQPRRLVEAVAGNALWKQLLAFDAVRELSDSTNACRAGQLLAYFEKQLGLGRMELLDRLTAGGIVLSARLGPQPAPALLILAGTDEQMVRRFSRLALEIAEQELARREAKEHFEKRPYRALETIHLGKAFHAAVAGPALLISNGEKPLQRALDLYLDGARQSLARSAQVQEARRLAGPAPLAWAWLNLETVRKAPGAKEVFALPRNDPGLTVLFGGWLDLARRAPFLCAGLHAEDRGFLLRLRLPRGWAGMPPELAAHLPPAGQPGSRPLLEPRGVLYSSSYYLDVAKFWEYRTRLFNAKQVKAVEAFDNNGGRLLGGKQLLSKLLTEAGAYQRLVIASPAKSGYKTAPQQPIPAFAFVLEMRQPERFPKRMEAALRAAALLATSQVKLKSVEEQYGGRQIVGYRFAEDAPLKGDITNFRFNFSPCFTAVGKQFVVCSTLELCRELVDLLNAEAKGAAEADSPAAVRTRLVASGLAELLETFQDRIFTQAVLDRAVPPAEAAEQVRQFLAWVRRLGDLQIEAAYGRDDFRYDLRLRLAP